MIPESVNWFNRTEPKSPTRKWESQMARWKWEAETQDFRKRSYLELSTVGAGQKMIPWRSQIEIARKGDLSGA